MILFHYSVDSYKEGKSLINGYIDHYKYAEPFVRALEKGINVFYSCFFSTMYMSREIRDLKLRKYENYKKDAVEGIFEFIRKKEYKGDSVSRLNCVYYCETAEEAINFLNEDCLKDNLFRKEEIKLLKVEVEEKSIKRYDQEFYNRALECLENCELEDIFKLARQYFSSERTNNPAIEILADGENTILEEIVF